MFDLQLVVNIAYVETEIAVSYWIKSFLMNLVESSDSVVNEGFFAIEVA